MSMAYTLFFKEFPPVLPPEFRHHVHITYQLKFRDLYISKHYTVLRIYGSQLKSYKLLVDLTVSFLWYSTLGKRLMLIMFIFFLRTKKHPLYFQLRLYHSLLKLELLLLLLKIQ
jgi:hypothetical protein